MRLQNIHNQKRKVYLFERREDGELDITEDTSFYPYFYARSSEGEFDTYDGYKAKKMLCAEPREVAQKRGSDSYEADVLYTKRFIIDNVEDIQRSDTKYIFFDIEIQATDMPNPEEAKDPVSCITTYNSYTKEYKTWFLPEWESEYKMVESFISYIGIEQPDLLLAWNVAFDYTYLYTRNPDFAKKISPVHQTRFGVVDKVYYPAGISILDYLALFKKIYMREQSYTLDKVAQKHLDEEAWKETKFGELTETVKRKNINDVKRMVKLETKYRMLEYYDEIRRFSRCLWEDLTANSKILDMIVLREARNRKLVLPNKSKERTDKDLQGAYRRADTGVYYDVYKADVASMYPNQLINFCLDATNIKKGAEVNTININNVWVKQNPDALLPHLSKSLINQKNEIKNQMSTASKEDYDRIKSRYDAIKGLVNSLYGVMAFPTFRLYNFEIASTITYLSRTLLMYVEEALKNMNFLVHYTDTDALMYEAEEDETELLNKLVTDWAIESYGKEEIDITFESEGMFTKILILGKCHYYGILKTTKGEKKEIKGMEIKRSSSSKYEAYFQEELIKRILNKDDKEVIIKWVKSETDRLKTLPLFDISFPCKISNRVYKNEPIFVRAYNNTRQFVKEFKLSKGELFRYIYVNRMGRDKNGKPINVLAISEKHSVNINRDDVDWDEMIRRNIVSKSNTIFDVLNWGSIELMLSNQTTLF